MPSVKPPYTREQVHSLLRACVSYADTFPEDEYFYAGNIAGRGDVTSDSTAVRRMLEWVSENGTGLIEDCGIGKDNIRYFRLGPNGRQTIDSGQPIGGEALFLSLSGGGLRATIFHLGVMLFLSTSKRLNKVRGMVSVSGGSIVAAHIVNHWEDAAGSEEGFARVAADLITFIRTDIRHRVFVPWLWSRLVPLNWWRRGTSRTARLRAIYDEHFRAQGLGGLAADGRPFLALVATDSIKQERIAFTPKEVLRFPILASSDGGPTPKDAVHRIVAGGVPLSLAVAASSCFPPVFPRLRLTNHDLGLNYEEFKEVLSVNDGGVTDNLGLEVLLALQTKGQDLGDRVVVCNVERPMRDKPGDGPLADQAAQAAALSKAAEARIVAESGRNCTFVRISDRPPSPLAVPFPVQTKLAVFRTDLDAPSWPEIQALLLHGYSCAAGALAEADYPSLIAETSRSRVAEILRLAGSEENLREPSAGDLDKSHRRPMRRIAMHAAFVLSAFVAVAAGSYAVWVKTNGNWESGAISLRLPRAPAITRPVPAEGMRKTTFLPEIDYRPFEMRTFEVSVDMRLWKPHLASELGQKTSPVVVTRKLVGIKKQPVDEIRIYGATEGTGIDADCTSGQPYWIQYALGQGNPRTVLMHEYHVVVDISSVPVNSRFEVEVQMTMWNGLKEKDPWLAFVAFADIPEFRVQVVFPEKRAYTTRKFVKYPNKQDQGVSAEGEFKQLEVPQHNRIYWEIKPAIKNTTYELQWEW